MGLGLRPPRVAVLIPSDLSMADAQILCTSLQRIWGGATFALIPNQAQSISPLFWDLLRMYDPDLLATFGGPTPDDNLRGELISRLSILNSWAEHFLPIWPGGSTYPLTEIAAVLKAIPESTNHVVPHVLALDVNTEDELALLMIAGAGGTLPANQQAELRELDVPLDKQSLDFGGNSPVMTPEPLWSSANVQGRSLPLDLSMLETATYSAPYQGDSFRPVFVVCGGTIEDFCLYWTIRALRGAPGTAKVFWLPGYDQPDGSDAARLRSSIAYAVDSALHNVDTRSKAVLFTSASVGHQELPLFSKAHEAALVIRIVGEEFAAEHLLDEAIVRRLENSIRIWEPNNSPNENHSIVQFWDGKGAALIETPSPKRMNAGYGSNVQWFVDAIIENFSPPRRRAVGRLLTERDPSIDLRPSKDGLSFLGVRIFTQGHMTNETITVQPRPLIPSDSAMFREFALDAGYKLTNSDKGNFEREWLELRNSLQETAGDLHDRRSARTLLKFVDGTPNQKGVLNQGAVVDKVRYLDLKAIQKLVRGRDRAAALANRYLRAGLIERGVLIKCPFCREAAWFAMEELTDLARCPRCGRSHVFPAQSDTFFRLDGVVRQALLGNSHVTVLTLDLLRRTSERGFHFVVASDLVEETQDGQNGSPERAEVDFMYSSDGILGAGECKAGGSLSKKDRNQLGRHVGLCRRLGVDTFVLATDATRWDKSAQRFIKDAVTVPLASAGIALRVLTGEQINWPLHRTRT